MARQPRSSENEGKKSKSSRRSGGRSSERESRSSRETGALSEVLDTLPEEAKVGARRMASEARRVFNRAKEYVSENPREAIGIAIAAGAVTWVALATKPGRYVFEASAAFLTPQVSRWFSKMMSSEIELEH